MKYLLTLGLAIAILLSVPAIAQEQQCTTDPAPGPQFTAQAVVFDLGTCFVFDGGTAQFTYSRGYNILFGDLLVSGPPSITLDYSTPDGYTMRYDVTVLGGSGQVPVSNTVTFIASGSGSWTAPLAITFAPGLRLRVIETVAIGDENAECFAWGYYCYHLTRFTLR